jgi:hypothetical protein
VTPDEHRDEAERLLERAGDYDATMPDAVACVQRAQVHATLATYRPMHPGVRRMQDDLLAKQGEIQGLREALRDVATSRAVQAPPTPAQHAERAQAAADRPKPGPPALPGLPGIWENFLNRFDLPDVAAAVLAEQDHPGAPTGSIAICRHESHGYSCSRALHPGHRRHLSTSGLTVIAAWPGEHLPTLADLEASK